MRSPFVHRHPLLTVIGSAVLVLTVLVAGLSVWFVRRNDIEAEGRLRLLRSSGGPGAMADAGTVIAVNGRHGAIFEGDSTALIVLITAPVSQVGLAHRIDSALAAAGFHEISATTVGDGGYFDKGIGRHRVTALVEIGDPDPAHGIDAGRMPGGRATARIEFS